MTEWLVCISIGMMLTAFCKDCVSLKILKLNCVVWTRMKGGQSTREIKMGNIMNICKTK